ncbi:MAG: VanZ family protein [Patescibacteria group bacterium]
MKDNSSGSGIALGIAIGTALGVSIDNIGVGIALGIVIGALFDAIRAQKSAPKAMQKRLIATLILIAYSAILIKVMVFKDMPLIKVDQLMLNFGGTATGHANFVPFKTIGPYLLGYKGWIIAGINLVGNIALLVPIGFLVPFIYRNMTRKKSLALAVAAGLVIEIMQTVLHVGIFDIDDVILNALGVMIGFWVFVILGKWVRERKYVIILIAVIIVVAATLATLYAVYPKGQPVNPYDRSNSFNTREGEMPQSGDLCGGTGGTGEITSVGSNTFTIERNDGKSHIVNLADRAVIKTLTGPISSSDLKIGERVTLVGGPNPDGSFTADTVVVCTVASSETRAGGAVSLR